MCEPGLHEGACNQVLMIYFLFRPDCACKCYHTAYLRLKTGDFKNSGNRLMMLGGATTCETSCNIAKCMWIALPTYRCAEAINHRHVCSSRDFIYLALLGEGGCTIHIGILLIRRDPEIYF